MSYFPLTSVLKCQICLQHSTKNNLVLTRNALLAFFLPSPLLIGVTVLDLLTVFVPFVVLSVKLSD